jgi:hypothetical protein
MVRVENLPEREPRFDIGKESLNLNQVSAPTSMDLPVTLPYMTLYHTRTPTYKDKHACARAHPYTDTYTAHSLQHDIFATAASAFV